MDSTTSQLHSKLYTGVDTPLLLPHDVNFLLASIASSRSEPLPQITFIHKAYPLGPNLHIILFKASLLHLHFYKYLIISLVNFSPTKPASTPSLSVQESPPKPLNSSHQICIPLLCLSKTQNRL